MALADRNAQARLDLPLKVDAAPAAQLAELARLVEGGPDLAVHGLVRWRCVDLQKEIKARFGVAISERHGS